MRMENVRLLLGRELVSGSIEFEETITDIRPGGRGDGPIVLPGLVDVHIHGAAGIDFSRGQDWDRAADWLLHRGVTTFLATAMTLPEAQMEKVLDTARTFGGNCAGLHLEGPFLSREKCGAQDPAWLKLPDRALFDAWQQRSGQKVRLVTAAPELPGAEEWIRETAKTCRVSVGHTAADYDTALAGFRAGADHLTHTYNAMPPLLHRAPGPIGAALTADAWAELICDGFHIHPAAVQTAFRTFGKKLVLISDATECTGMPDGAYTLGGQPVELRGGRVTLADGTLAGSATDLPEMLRRAVGMGIPLAHAAYAAATAPARSVGLPAGELLAGRTADLMVLDDDLSLLSVYQGGREVK